ncbi:hypothetical protein BC938DRAFT_473741 [Jimgerdemannia flammicorona]|uniref:Uncharacterized protein n=1 Tax=Jimgerdemannia flammicorona TaxID=994334 RepID=A0A433QT58_9FUNG|nr:hypothetical protein BC938DRAFT_473741 [Jimgerdemannia flammicorona]
MDGITRHFTSNPPITMQNGKGKKSATTSNTTCATSTISPPTSEQTRLPHPTGEPSSSQQSVRNMQVHHKKDVKSPSEIIENLKAKMLHYELNEITSLFELLTLADEPTTIRQLKNEVEERNTQIAQLQKVVAAQLETEKQCRSQLFFNNSYIIQGEHIVSELSSRNNTLEMRMHATEDEMIQAQSVWKDDQKFTLIKLAVCEARVAELEAFRKTAGDQHDDVVRANNELVLRLAQLEKESAKQLGKLEINLAIAEVTAKAMEGELVLEKRKVEALEAKLTLHEVEAKAMQELLAERNGTVTRLEGELAMESEKAMVLGKKLAIHEVEAKAMQELLAERNEKVTWLECELAMESGKAVVLGKKLITQGDDLKAAKERVGKFEDLRAEGEGCEEDEGEDGGA